MKPIEIDRYIANLSIDCVVFGYEDMQLKVLLGKKKFGKELYNLPGGYILKTESVDEAAARLLMERTSIKDLHLRQFKVFGDADRIRGSANIKKLIKEYEKIYSARQVAWMTDRFVCVGYFALVEISKVRPVPGEFDERFEWRPLNDIPELMYDHREILEEALLALRRNFDQNLNAFDLLPGTFTMKELQNLYQAVHEREFPMNNFQKKMLVLNVLERLEKKYTGAQNKAPYLYRFRK